MNYDAYTKAINRLLDEINGLKGLDLEIHPFWSCPILDARNMCVGYKLHSKGDNRIMSLAVDTFSGFEQSPDGQTVLTANAKERIAQAMEEFWAVGNVERHVFLEV
jgi:hypothetical protein